MEGVEFSADEVFKTGRPDRVSGDDLFLNDEEDFTTEVTEAHRE
jgi:hypothetical protein